MIPIRDEEAHMALTLLLYAIPVALAILVVGSWLNHRAYKK